MPADLPWPEALRRLRAALPPRREDGHLVGSLRWLEAEVGRRGGQPMTVRNIVYRDIGTSRDKRLLSLVLRDLGGEAGLDLDLPALPLPPDEAAGHLSLGKRRLYRRFLAEVRRGKAARLLIVAGPGAGKTILVNALAHALPGSLSLRLEGDFAPELERLAAGLGLPGGLVTQAVARLDERAPFSVNGAVQQDLGHAFVGGLAAAPPTALLLRAGAHGTLAGHPLRLPGGDAASPGAWLWHHLLMPLAGEGGRPPLLAALSDDRGLPDDLGAFREVVPLPSPSLGEARKFVRAKLPHLPPPEVEAIVRRAGRDYDNLGLLTLLAAVGQDPQEPPAQPLPAVHDADLLNFLRVVGAAFSPEFPDATLTFFEAVLGGPLATRRDVERAFLEPAGAGRVRPTRPDLAARLVEGSGTRGPEAELHRRAVRAALSDGDVARALHHALRGELWDALPGIPAAGTALEAAWRAAQTGDAPRGVTEHLARALAAEYALRGQYDHPDMAAALGTLSRSPDEGTRTWAAVKRAEALIDAARYAEAAAQLVGPPGRDPVTRAEHALSLAAVARWEGRPDLARDRLDEAETVARDAPGEYAPALQVKVRLWRALAAKDLGEWAVALPLLTAVMHDSGAPPLHRARAAYQLGDALMRLGQQERARSALETAVRDLAVHHAPPDEVSRAWARLGSVMRRLGQLDAARKALDTAARLAPDAFTLARALSEAVPLHAGQGRFDLAFAAGRQAWGTFRDAEVTRPSEARYRRLRVEYRVALAYLARGLGIPYLPPMTGARGDHPDLAHARALLEGVQGDLPSGDADRLASLRLDVALALALATPDLAVALAHARAGVGHAAHPYQAVQARIGLAEALLRASRHDEALSEVNRAFVAARHAARVTGDHAWCEPGLGAWLAALEFGAGQEAAPELAWQGLRLALDDPALRAFRGSLAGWATVLLAQRRARLMGALGDDALLAPADAARLHFGGGTEGQD